MRKEQERWSDSGHQRGSQEFAENVTFGPSSVDHARLKMTGMREKAFPAEAKDTAQTEEELTGAGRGAEPGGGKKPGYK